MRGKARKGCRREQIGCLSADIKDFWLAGCISQGDRFVDDFAV